MGKLTTYVMLMSAAVLVFYFAGLLDETPNSALFTLLFNPQEIEFSSIWDNATLAIEGLILGAAVILGFITMNNELGAMAGFAIFFFNFFLDFMSVFNKLKSINPTLSLLILSPILVLFIVTIVEWWRGRD